MSMKKELEKVVHRSRNTKIMLQNNTQEPLKSITANKLEFQSFGPDYANLDSYV